MLGAAACFAAWRFRAGGSPPSEPPAIERRPSADAPTVADGSADSAPIARHPFAVPTPEPAPGAAPEPTPTDAAPRGGTGLPIVLTARLLDPLGAPIVETCIDFRLDLAQSEESFPLLRTDTDGVFRWRVGDGTAAFRAARRVSFGVRPWSADALTAVVRLDRNLKEGVDDLGTVTLMPPPLVVGGTVVDEFGSPHGGAKLHVCLPVDGAAADAPVSERFRPAWSAIRTTADAEGRFSLRGELPATALALLPQPLAAPMGEITAVVAGPDPVRLVVPRGGSAAGRVLVDDPVVCAELEVRAYRAVDDAEDDFVVPGADGTFLLNRLSPGRIRITIARGGRVLFDCAEVVVVAGACERDERLAAVDLRTGAKPVDVLVVDESGRPIPGAQVRAGEAGMNVANGTTGKDGRVRLLVPKPPVDIGVSYERYLEGAHRTVVARGVTKECRVVMKPGLPVVVVPSSRSPLPAGCSFTIELYAVLVSEPEGMSGAPFDHLERVSFVPLRHDGRTTLPCPGRYGVSLSLAGPNGLVTPIVRDPSIIVVHDLEAEQRFVVGLDAIEFEQALRIVISKD